MQAVASSAHMGSGKRGKGKGQTKSWRRKHTKYAWHIRARREFGNSHPCLCLRVCVRTTPYACMRVYVREGMRVYVRACARGSNEERKTDRRKEKSKELTSPPPNTRQPETGQPLRHIWRLPPSAHHAASDLNRSEKNGSYIFFDFVVRDVRICGCEIKSSEHETRSHGHHKSTTTARNQNTRIKTQVLKHRY